MLEHNHELDFVCPQCGPDEAGADTHAMTRHTWPPGKGKRCPVCQGMPMMVRKVHKDPDEPFIPEIDLFPWRAWCQYCPWRTSTGAQRDAFDLAFYHALGGVHIEPEDLSVVLPTVVVPTVLLRMEEPGESDHTGNPDPGSSNDIPSFSPGGLVREDPLEDYDPCQNPYYEGGSYY